MRDTARSLLSSILIGVVSLGVIIGAFSLATAEVGLIPGQGGLLPAGSGTPTGTASPSATSTATVTATATATMTATATASRTSTASTTPPASCPPPLGWVPVVVQAGQTLESLAAQYDTTVAALMQANCLTSSAPPPPGTVIYVPPSPAPTAIPCTGPPAGWVIYIVQPGDTLYHIASLYRITVAQLMTANCLTSTVIIAGQQLYVPNVPTSTPSVVTPTWTPTPTPTGPTSTSTSTPTDTATPTASDTPLPTDTPAPTATDTPTPTPTPG